MNGLFNARRSVLLGGLALVCTMFVLSACDLASLNENGNDPTDPTLPYLLTNAQEDLAATHSSEFYLGRFKMTYAQYWSQTQYVDESRYAYPLRRTTSVDGEWENYYIILRNLQELIDRNQGENAAEATSYGPNANQIAIAKIMQAYIYQTITDIWGPAPYGEALQGRDNITPAYASQEQIYTNIVDSLLNPAINGIQEGASALAGGDKIFGGDMSKWKAFGNSLKMRVAIRAAETNPEGFDPATVFQEAYDATTLDELEAAAADEAALIPFSVSTPTYRNPIAQNYANREDFAVSTTLLEGIMNPVSDPRRAAYAQLSPGGDYQGFPYGLTKGPALGVYKGGDGDYSKLGLQVAGSYDVPSILMLPDEPLFDKAEAAERGWIDDGDASQFYQDAIKSSLDYWEVDDADSYLSRVPLDNSTDWAPAGNSTLQRLGIQKWIAEYLQGLQGWSTFRRLDFQGILVTPPGNPGQAIFQDSFPVRLSYPSTERSLNGMSYDTAVSDLLGDDDDQGTRLWWDTDPQAEPAN